jgi:hypothetical protein
MNRFKLGESLDSIVRKHLLTLSRHPLNDDDIEIAIHKGWQARDEEIKELESKLAKAKQTIQWLSDGIQHFTNEGDREQVIHLTVNAEQALKEIE